MGQYKVIDYHIELMALQDFVNTVLAPGQLSIEGNTIIFNCMKRVILNADLKPFLVKSDKSDPAKSDYYKKYEFAEKGQDLNYIPDFFSFEGDFYEMAQPFNVNLRSANSHEFSILFNLKLLETESTGLPIKEFLNFQLYDNFLGDKMKFESFLIQLRKTNTLFRISDVIVNSIKEWIAENNPQNGLSFYNLIFDEEPLPEDKLNALDKLEEADSKNSDTGLKPFKIEGNFTDAEILKFFSLLYLEKSFDKRPFLAEAAVREIFKNGFVIPDIQPAETYKINYDSRSPRKIIDFAIHLFFRLHSKTQRDKSDFLRFFGSYIIDYSDAIKSKEKLTQLASNISGEKSPKSKIKWEDYLPERYRNLFV